MIVRLVYVVTIRILGWLALLARRRSELIVEVLVLRHELTVVKGNHSVPVPTVSSTQRFAEGQKAEALRQARRELLDHVAAGKASIQSVLTRADTDSVVATTKVSQLVQALPGYGPGKTVSALNRAGITVHTRVESLEPRRREALLGVLAR